MIGFSSLGFIITVLLEYHFPEIFENGVKYLFKAREVSLFNVIKISF